MVTFADRVVDPSLAWDRSDWYPCTIKTKFSEQDLTLSEPCLQENLFRMIKEPRVVTLIKALKGSVWEIENSGTNSIDKLVLTEDKKLALTKVEESLKYRVYIYIYSLERR